MTAKDQEAGSKKLDLGKETIKDLDVPSKKAKNVKGGATGGCPHPEQYIAPAEGPTQPCTV